MAKPYRWDAVKNDWLERERGVGFADIVNAIKGGNLLDDVENPSPRYPGQRMYIIYLHGYAMVVPYVEDEKEIFLKTIFPNRKLKRMYLAGNDHDKPQDH